MNKECTWTYEYIIDYWATECGNEFTMIWCTPKDNGFKFCPYCGGALRFVVPAVEQERSK